MSLDIQNVYFENLWIVEYVIDQYILKILFDWMFDWNVNNLDTVPKHNIFPYSIKNPNQLFDLCYITISLFVYEPF